MTRIISYHDPKLIIRGIHLSLTAGMRTALEKKAERLFRHEPDILRVRIDVERDALGRVPMFIAKGRVELPGPDLTAAVTSDRTSTSVNLLIDKLDRMLRKRASNRMRRRGSDDIRTHVAESAAV
jgi:putative sigma-54 modulation protein